MAPPDRGVRVDQHERAVGHPGRLEVRAEQAGRRALGLEVAQLRDADAERVGEGLLAVRRVGGHAVEIHALLAQVGEHLFVDLQLVGADRAEGEGVEDEDGRAARQRLRRDLLITHEGPGFSRALRA